MLSLKHEHRQVGDTPLKLLRCLFHVLFEASSGQGCAASLAEWRFVRCLEDCSNADRFETKEQVYSLSDRNRNVSKDMFTFIFVLCCRTRIYLVHERPRKPRKAHPRLLTPALPMSKARRSATFVLGRFKLPNGPTQRLILGTGVLCHQPPRILNLYKDNNIFDINLKAASPS